MRLWTASIFALMLARAAFAETLVIKKAASATVAPDQLAAVDELIQSASAGTAGVTVTDDAKRADAVLEPRVLRIGSAYVLIVNKFRAGKLVFKTQARANSIEDMDTVAGRVVRSALTETPFEDNVAVNDVTEDEVNRGKRRISAVQQIFVGIGPAGGWNYNAAAIGGNVILGKTWSLDADFSLDLAGELMWIPGGAYGGDVHGALEYYLNRNNHSPFLIADFGYGFAAVNVTGADPLSGLLELKEKTGGFLVGGGAGFKMFRAHSTGLGFSVRYLFNTGTTSLGHPSQLVGAVTMYF